MPECVDQGLPQGLPPARTAYEEYQEPVAAQGERAEVHKKCILHLYSSGASGFASTQLIRSPLFVRRNHRLARHADILQCIETRISMLMMTYSKYIEANMCCFIPGKVIDEVLRLLRLVGNTSEQFRAREILQELRDITSMAIEHFEEKIAPDLKQGYQDHAKFQLKGTPFALIINAIRSGSSVSLSDSSMLDASTSSAAPTVDEEHQQHQAHTPVSSRSLLGSGSSSSSNLRSSPDTHGFFVAKMNALIKRAQVRHTKVVRQQNAEIAELRSQVADLKRRVEETDAKNREIHLNVNQMSSQQPAVASAGEVVIRKPNIKPRTATIILKRRLEQFDREKAAALVAAAAAVVAPGDEGEGQEEDILERVSSSKRPRRKRMT